MGNLFRKTKILVYRFYQTRLHITKDKEKIWSPCWRVLSVLHNLVFLFRSPFCVEHLTFTLGTTDLLREDQTQRPKQTAHDTFRRFMTHIMTIVWGKQGGQHSFPVFDNFIPFLIIMDFFRKYFFWLEMFRFLRKFVWLAFRMSILRVGSQWRLEIWCF